MELASRALARRRVGRVPRARRPARGNVVAWIGARVAEALHHAHEARADDGSPQQLVHRDVNPANVVISYDGHVKLIDFGLVKGKGRISETEMGVVKGKLAYLSPEQAHGNPIDRRSDVFQLGTTLWELSTDRRLFKRETDVETVAAIRNGVVPDPTTPVRARVSVAPLAGAPARAQAQSGAALRHGGRARARSRRRGARAGMNPADRDPRRDHGGALRDDTRARGRVVPSGDGEGAAGVAPHAAPGRAAHTRRRR